MVAWRLERLARSWMSASGDVGPPMLTAWPVSSRNPPTPSIHSSCRLSLVELGSAGSGREAVIGRVSVSPGIGWLSCP
ncbi:MAG: hypothetical protein CMJ69_16265 [Planctomycetaceae bacterium]|nr:hypothetical protein [Planctomycetaceae bacterium]